MIRFFKILLFGSFCVFCSCVNNRKKIDIENTINDSIEVDTTYYKTGEIEQILSINKKNKLLNGRCESYYVSGNLKTTKFFYNDTAKGNSFEYYPTGQLHRYAYIAYNDYSPYDLEYDSSGKIINEEGTPFVGCDIVEFPKDTLQIQLYLSNYGSKNLNFEVSFDGKKYTEVKKLHKGIIEGSEVAKMWASIIGVNHVNIYMKINSVDSANSKVYFDTLSVR